MRRSPARSSTQERATTTPIAARLYNSYNWGLDFQPRIGFAYTPGMFHGTFVIRGAYTISSYLEGTGTNLRLPLNPPLNQEFDTRYDSTNLALPLVAQFAGTDSFIIARPILSQARTFASGIRISGRRQ